jgi:hypothetical protein
MAVVHQHRSGFMSQQLYKLLSRLARRQHRKLGHVFIRVARSRSGQALGRTGYSDSYGSSRVVIDNT